MMRFAKGVMWVMQYVFGMPREQLLYEADEREGMFILRSVMDGGNFGHYKEGVMSIGSGKVNTALRVVRHNLHLFAHYPEDAIWPPFYFVWHKLWKLKHRNI